MTGPIVPLLIAAFLAWAGSVIENGWRVKRAEKRNELRAWGRCVERAKGPSK